MKKIFGLSVLISIVVSTAIAQVTTPAQQLIMTNEDSLNAGVSSSKTVLSGYGSAFYQRNTNQQTANITLERIVLFVGHQFNSKISVFTELEVENAKVEGGKSGGEVSIEQAFLKFNLNSRQYIAAGLLLPRIGILNENHLPVNFFGVERPLVEQFIIPCTWRELGIGFYGRLKKLPVNYSIALLNGLNAAGFEHGSPIREGRYEGQNATANNLALTGSLQYLYNDFIFQVSGYAGGSNGLNKRSSDSLELSSGMFGLPVYLGEADIRWSKNGWNAKALGAFISIPDAYSINKAYANNTSSTSYGAYAEVAYNLFENKPKLLKQQLNAFTRFETMNLNNTIPSNGIYDGTLDQQNLIIGFAYLPIPNVVIKTDVRLLHTSPVALPYQQNNSLINIGIGYSF